VQGRVLGSCRTADVVKFDDLFGQVLILGMPAMQCNTTGL
jgi:hypothetical protein